LFEGAYEDCLRTEPQDAGIPFQRQALVPATYKGKRVIRACRADLPIGDDLIVEIKSIDAIAPIHEAQVLTDLRLSGRRFGLLFNFNTLARNKASDASSCNLHAPGRNTALP